MSEVYQKNLISLQNKNIKLAKKIDKLSVENKDFKILKTKNNEDYTIEIKLGSKIKLVHSIYSPKEQAKRKIEKLDLDFYNLIGVAGIGFGYYIEVLLEKLNKQSQIVIIENRLDILKKVMKYKDLTSIFNSNNVTIFDGTSSKYVSEMNKKLKRFDFMALVAGNVDFFQTPVLKELEKKKYNEFNKKFIKVLRYSANSLGNAPGDTTLGLEHAFENVEHLFKTSIDFSKKNKFNNKPAVCVASGPSLDKNIDVLKEYQDKVNIFSAGTSLHKLVNYGIKPDVFSILERPEKVYRYTVKDLIEGDNYPEETIAFLDGVVHPKIFKAAEPNLVTVFRNTVPTENWFVENIEDLIGLNTGLSVANLNFMIAHLLGFEPIILIGQDLSFSSKGEQHVEGTIYDKLGEKEISKEDIVEVEGYNGEKLKARKIWQTFKHWFESEIKEKNIHSIDATEGGAYIEGTEIMTLQNVADRYFTDEKPQIKDIIKYHKQEEIKNKALKLKEELDKKLENLSSIEKRIEYIISELKLIKNVTKLKEKSNTVNKNFALEKYQSLNREISFLMVMDACFYFICQAPFVELERNKVRKGDIKKNTYKKLNKWLDYNIDKISDLNNILDETIDIYKNGANKLSDLINEKENNHE